MSDPLSLSKLIATVLSQKIGDWFRKPQDRGFDTYQDMSAKLPEKVVLAALSQVGIHEDSRNHGTGIDKYWKATSYPEGYADRAPYCAAFVCWAVQQAMEFGTYTFKRPTTAAAWGFEEWSLAQDNSTSTKKKPRGDIKRGDLIVYTFSHIGIATSAVDKNGHFGTVEANTDGSGSREGDGVYAKTRHIDQVRARIRFTV